MIYTQFLNKFVLCKVRWPRDGWAFPSAPPPPISHRFVGATWYPQVQALPLGSLAGLLGGVK